MIDDDLAPSSLPGDDEAYTVRPYTVTGGRVVGEGDGLPVETLVSAANSGEAALKGLTPEKKKILQLAAEDFISVAELSAHCKLPLGVVRVLVTDLADHGLLTIHTNAAPGKEAAASGGITLSLLESVLDGIAAL